MKTLKRLLLIAATLCCFIQVQGADDYSDSKRPYEFGFTIDGQQHRHEKKDKNGIIMGEFGFITADDVYHVTVYATDENGRFRILSMKNIHLKATPDYTQGYRQGHSLQLPTATLSPTLSKPTSVEPSSALIPQQPTQKPQNNFKPIPIEPPVNSCSHCSLPTTSTVAPKPAISPNVQSNNNNYNSNTNLFNTPGISGVPYSQGGISPSKYPGQQNAFSTPLSSEPVNGGGQYSQAVSSPSNYPYQQNTVNKPSNVSPPVFSRPNQQNVIGSTLTGQAPLTSANPYNPSPNYPQNTISGTQYPQQANQGPNYSQISPLNSISSYKPQNQNGVSYANDNGGIAGGLSEVEKQAKSYSQTQAPGAAPSNNAVPYNLQSNNEIRYPAQNLSPTLSSSNAEKYSPSNSQAGLSNFLGSRTGKQFSQTPTKASGFNQQNYPLSGTSVPGLQGGPSVPTKPTLVSAQMQLVDKNTDINYKRPGEKNGLPEGLTENDMMNLLYTFNYTLGFQAHYEQGYSNGFKQGYYYVTGRNGIRTRIDYTADNTGFHPKISQDVLDLLSDDVPKPETEKDAKYGLRGYEFKWLYYPVEHKTQ